MRIEVFSDVVCPWCYLGERRLALALEGIERRGDVEVVWRAFQLDPGATAEARPLRPAIERKYGPGAFEAMVGRLAPLGREVGIDYRFDDVVRVTSLPALRLLAWARAAAGPAPADDLHDRLFRAYFTEGRNVADEDVLVDLGRSVGLDGDEVAAAVASGAGAEEVSTDLRDARDLGITGVPSFVIGGQWVIPGAQDVEWLRQAVERMLARAGGG